MTDFSQKTIAIGICGGIAAYKACDLIRELQRRDATRVIPLMTASAQQFITPLTLQSLSREEVITSELKIESDGTPTHIKLAQQADVLVIVPATVNTIAKLANGFADDIISTTFMTFTNKPVVIAPAMNTRMWHHPIFEENLEKLERLPNVSIVDPIAGNLACGETGDGHLASQEIILAHIYKAMHAEKNLYANQRAIVTAGGTREAIDPVRVLTNKSSGKMGIAMADELWAMGAEVTLVTSVKNLEKPYAIIPVESALEMQTALENRFDECDVLVMAAAVGDFTAAASPQKIKRQGKPRLQLELTANPDIIGELAKRKRENQIVIGFAAESENLLENAQEKLTRKNLDAIVANDISRNDIGFDADQNEITLLIRDEEPVVLPKAGKDQIAREVLMKLDSLNFSTARG